MATRVVPGSTTILTDAVFCLVRAGQCPLVGELVLPDAEAWFRLTAQVHIDYLAHQAAADTRLHGQRLEREVCVYALNARTIVIELFEGVDMRIRVSAGLGRPAFAALACLLKRHGCWNFREPGPSA